MLMMIVELLFGCFFINDIVKTANTKIPRPLRQLHVAMYIYNGSFLLMCTSAFLSHILFGIQIPLSIAKYVFLVIGIIALVVRLLMPYYHVKKGINILRKLSHAPVSFVKPSDVNILADDLKNGNPEQYIHELENNSTKMKALNKYCSHYGITAKQLLNAELDALHGHDSKLAKISEQMEKHPLSLQQIHLDNINLTKDSAEAVNAKHTNKAFSKSSSSNNSVGSSSGNSVGQFNNSSNESISKSASSSISNDIDNKN